jgi:hypothetical protein
MWMARTIDKYAIGLLLESMKVTGYLMVTKKGIRHIDAPLKNLEKPITYPRRFSAEPWTACS